MNTENSIILRDLKTFQLIWLLFILFCGLEKLLCKVVALEKEVDGCKLVSPAKLFGSPLE